MKISKLIKQLEKIKNEHGDLEVFLFSDSFDFEKINNISVGLTEDIRIFMIETLLDFLCNSSDFRKEHNLGFIVRDEDGKELCNSKETKTLEDWMNNPVINMVVTKSEETETDIIITVVDWDWER